MTQDINNNVLITASSHGLGLAIAKKFSENNHGVIIHGRNIDSIHHASKCIDNVICTIRGDLRNPSTIEKIYNKVDVSDSELDEFIDSLTGEQFNSLMEFFI